MGLIAATLESLTKTMTQDIAFSEAELWVSLHSADPAGTGANEVTTGTGANARQQPAYTGSGGTDSNALDTVFTLAAVTVTWIGYWTAQTGGTFLGGFPLVGEGCVLATASGSTLLTCPTHGRSVNDPVRLFTLPGSAVSAIPAGFTADTLYYVVAVASANVLELGSTIGGSPITASGPGGCGIFLDEGVYTETGTLTFPMGLLAYATS